MRMVLFVVFWAWLAASVAIYGYRLWRRVTQGPKAVREARAATDAGRSAALGAEAPTDEPVPGSPVQATTVAAALHGIELPCDLAPIVDVDDASAAVGRRVVFTTRSSDVRTVAAALTRELDDLGYQTSDAPTDTSGNRRRLIATRADATVSVTVSLDDNGTVAAEVTT